MDERQTALAVVQELPEEQFQALKLLLEGQIPGGLLLAASRPELCRLLLQRFPGRSRALLAGTLRQLGRPDLIQRFQLPLEPGIPNGGAPGATPNPAGNPPPLERQIPQGIPNGDPARSLGSSSGAIPNPAGNRLLTERDLMQIAQKLGREWQRVGILCLELEQSRLEQIQQENPGDPVLWSFQMLREWRRRQRHEATASRLRSQLEPVPLDPGILLLLRSLEGP
ncbi:uncharacterized protein LOC113940875 [Corapipo altera]|uniref:uncharacterized protein LOC113940866 n=1 Tax=Corapipo altera TaxID=415028 RepID=UPI000FD64767|nr:uncharacterized protein LOC113940866 [Corapipo altera]XP_027487826.1 uncharacterized protein LOC113940875 [Corapipo altera]